MQEKEETPILGIIKQIYKIADFEPTLAKKYTEQIIPLEKELHLDYMVKCFQSRWVERLDSGKPWLLFWVTAVVNLISSTENILKLSEQREVIKFINCCQSPEGGFGGSEGYLPQIASTYAAVCCLVNLGSKEALEVINVKGMKNFLIKMKYNGEERAGNKITDIKTNVRGSFEIHENGENDLRAIYCALIVGDILGLNEEPEIREGIAEYIEECQTYEGGLACIPFGEAHGGYTYCGLCSLHLLGEKEVFNLDLPRLLEWWVNRQIEGQGGFNGRINKLVDSCYNFWQGALSEVLDIILKGAANYQGQWLIDQKAVQAYTVLCCQYKEGGMLDKPQKFPDLYHTCYSLSGLSILQSTSNFLLYEGGLNPNLEGKDSQNYKFILGEDESALLKRVHPVYNIQHEKLNFAKKYFAVDK